MSLTVVKGQFTIIEQINNKQPVVIFSGPNVISSATLPPIATSIIASN